MSKPRITPPNKGKINEYAVPTLAEARALHALMSNDNAKVALNWILKGACRAGQEIFAGHPESTAYLAGRLSVSLQVGWVLGQPVEAFRQQGETD